ncbi:MAG: hypothetical protein ACE5J7_02575 [Candidatus Aenigmatarchaeota archaeon]
MGRPSKNAMPPQGWEEEFEETPKEEEDEDEWDLTQEDEEW